LRLLSWQNQRRRLSAKAGCGSVCGDQNGVEWLSLGRKSRQLDTVNLLLRQDTPLEIKNIYGGTVLGTAVWSAIHEPKPDHIAIIETLISAGARLDTAGFPTGNERVDEVLRRRGV
jgi:hypothetical protein